MAWPSLLASASTGCAHPCAPSDMRPWKLPCAARAWTLQACGATGVTQRRYCPGQLAHAPAWCAAEVLGTCPSQGSLRVTKMAGAWTLARTAPPS
eukprot:12081636-Alexandrium_andersonii.AAC.1